MASEKDPELSLETTLQIILAVDRLKADLEDLPRIARGSLSAASKQTASLLVKHFHHTTSCLKFYNPVLHHVLEVIQNLASELEESTNDDKGGKASVEKLFSQIIYHVGFIKGYLYLYYEHANYSKSTPHKQPKADSSSSLGRLIEDLHL